MAEDKTGWSEKGKSASDGEGSKTPQRPSKRQASNSDGESKVVRAPSGDAGARKVAKAAATAGQRDVSFASRLGFPALIALICLLGIGTVAYARSTREPLLTPRENLDHWHAVYGVYNCNAPGEDKYLPPFLSNVDQGGIHSHGDGLMHIHPFLSATSGDNAQIRHWLTEMQVTINTERISVQNVFDPAVELVAGEECADGSGKAEIKVLQWDIDIVAEVPADEGRKDPDVVYTEDLGQIKFEKDRQVFIFAYVGENTDISDIPSPPAARFNILNNVSAAIEYDGNALNPVETGVDVDDADEDGDS